MFSFTSIRDYHNLLFNGQTTCVKAVNYFLHNIKENIHLNAFLEVYDDEALSRAKQLDADFANGKQPGKLHGVVVALKDVICYKDHRVSASSKILQDFVSIYNATVVEKLLSEGAIIIGRNNCDEFAMGSSNENSAFGKVLNSADNTRVAGGSSGGSAVAVQAKLCMISLGSDTGGSVRQPADFCGVIGFKPSYGVISRYGLIAYASSFDQIGIFANSIEDVAITLEVIAGKDEFDSTANNYNGITYSEKKYSKAKPFKIAYFRQTLENPGLDEQISSAVKGFIETLTSKGWKVQPFDFELFEYVVPAYYVLTTAEASSNLSRYDGVRFGYSSIEKEDSLLNLYKTTRSEGFGKEVKRRIMLGTFVLSAGFYQAYFTKAQQIRTMLTNHAQSIFEEYDAIISPTVPSVAFRFGEKSHDPVEMFLADIYTVFANLVGIPAISLPLFKHRNGMPFGLQVMTSKKNDLLLLRLSNDIYEMRKYQSSFN